MKIIQMKKNIPVLLLFAIFSACGDGITENTMIVSGQVKGLKKGTLYLQQVPDSTLVVIDSLQVTGDGSFSFQTEIEEADIFYLYLNKKDNNDINDRISFFGEPGTITINTSWNTFDSKAEVKGSKVNEKYVEFKEVMSGYNKRSLEFMNTNSNADLTDAQLDSLQNLANRNTKKSYAFALNYALNNLDSPIAPYIAMNHVSDANVKYLDSIYNSLEPSIANSKFGEQLKRHLNQLHP